MLREPILMSMRFFWLWMKDCFKISMPFSPTMRCPLLPLLLNLFGLWIHFDHENVAGMKLFDLRGKIFNVHLLFFWNTCWWGQNPGAKWKIWIPRYCQAVRKPMLDPWREHSEMPGQSHLLQPSELWCQTSSWTNSPLQASYHSHSSYHLITTPWQTQDRTTLLISVNLWNHEQ